MGRRRFDFLLDFPREIRDRIYYLAILSSIKDTNFTPDDKTTAFDPARLRPKAISLVSNCHQSPDTGRKSEHPPFALLLLGLQVYPMEDIWFRVVEGSTPTTYT